MKRRNFIVTTLGGLVSLPFIKAEPERAKPEKVALVMRHRESYSSVRAVDTRIISDELVSKEMEETLVETIRRNPRRIQRILNG